MKIKHVVIIGIGLNGSCVANELVKKKFKVTAIDAFDLLDKKIFEKKPQKRDFSKLQYSLSLIKSLISNFGNNPFKNPLFFRINSLISNKNKNIISSNKDKFSTYGVNKIGGRGHLWGRVSPRFPKNEFADFKEWPIKYKDIKKYYSELENKFLLTGDKKKKNGGNVVKEKKFNEIEKSFLSLVKNKWKNRVAKVLPTLNYNSGPLNPMLKEIIKSKNFSIIKNTIVTKIITDKNAKAVGVEFINRLSLKKSLIYCDYIFLSGSPLETIKILLNSKCKKFLNGIGNDKKLVGKKFFDHIGISFSALLFKKQKNKSDKNFNPLNPNKKTNGFYFVPFRKKEKKNKLILNYSIHGTIDKKRNIISIYSFADCPSYSKNIISISKDKRDIYGVPFLKVNFKWMPEQISTWKDQKIVIQELVSILKKNFNYDLHQSISNFKVFNKLPNPGFSHHESGGAIMGHSPNSSVVNKFGQIWNCKNVYVCDQSIFPRLNYVNPTLTCMAISLRSARIFTKATKNKF